jgi:hypothetical protein
MLFTPQCTLHFPFNVLKTFLGRGSNGRASASQPRGPEFKLQYHLKKKKKEKENILYHIDHLHLVL